jgi:hypothetical protein
MRVNRINSAFFLLAAFMAVQLADIFDSVPFAERASSETISIRSNDLPFALANAQTRVSTHVTNCLEKTSFQPDFLELKRHYSILIHVSFDHIFSSLVERPTTALYVRLLRILV